MEKKWIVSSLIQIALPKAHTFVALVQGIFNFFFFFFVSIFVILFVLCNGKSKRMKSLTRVLFHRCHPPSPAVVSLNLGESSETSPFFEIIVILWFSISWSETRLIQKLLNSPSSIFFRVSCCSRFLCCCGHERWKDIGSNSSEMCIWNHNVIFAVTAATILFPSFCHFFFFFCVILLYFFANISQSIMVLIKSVEQKRTWWQTWRVERWNVCVCVYSAHCAPFHT